MRLAVAWLALAAAAPAAADTPICADRPSKATGTCTVPAGKFQLEGGLLDGWTLRQAGSRTTTIIVGATALKLGLGPRSDVELAVTPLVWTRTGGRTDAGLGDTVVRIKQRLTADSAPVQLALLPFVKLPTARRALGNGRIEGGLAVPASVALGKALTLTVAPEIDLLADSDGKGSHVGVIQVANLGVAVTPRLSLGGEYWASWNVDPAGTIRQRSVDVAAAYLANDRLQFDAGVNLGLSAATPDAEFYLGVSRRF